MASGSSSDAAEPAEPAAAPAAAETEEDQVKRRRLQSLGFALVTRCDTTMAPTFLLENNWQAKVSSRFSIPPLLPGGRARPASLYFYFPESVERLLRAASGRPSTAAPASDLLQVRGLVSDRGRGQLAEGGEGPHAGVEMAAGAPGLRISGNASDEARSLPSVTCLCCFETGVSPS